MNSQAIQRYTMSPIRNPNRGLLDVAGHDSGQASSRKDSTEEGERHRQDSDPSLHDA